MADDLGQMSTNYNKYVRDESPRNSTNQREVQGEIDEGAAHRWTCEICDKTLSTKYNLARHLKIHFPAELLTCKICGKKMKGNLVRHMESHEEPTLKCRVCGKKFKLPQQLKEHVSLHGGEKPFKCPSTGCSYSGRTKDLLRHHRKYNRH